MQQIPFRAVYQLHAGATRLQYPVEDVPQWDDRTSRAVLEFRNDESESDKCININLPIGLFMLISKPKWGNSFMPLKEFAHY